jgi:hypothetical protein
MKLRVPEKKRTRNSLLATETLPSIKVCQQWIATVKEEGRQGSSSSSSSSKL